MGCSEYSQQTEHSTRTVLCNGCSIYALYPQIKNMQTCIYTHFVIPSSLSLKMLKKFPPLASEQSLTSRGLICTVGARHASVISTPHSWSHRLIPAKPLGDDFFRTKTLALVLKQIFLQLVKKIHNGNTTEIQTRNILGGRNESSKFCVDSF